MGKRGTDPLVVITGDITTTLPAMPGHGMAEIIGLRITDIITIREHIGNGDKIQKERNYWGKCFESNLTSEDFIRF